MSSSETSKKVGDLTLLSYRSGSHNTTLKRTVTFHFSQDAYQVIDTAHNTVLYTCQFSDTTNFSMRGYKQVWIEGREPDTGKRLLLRIACQANGDNMLAYLKIRELSNYFLLHGVRVHLKPFQSLWLGAVLQMMILLPIVLAVTLIPIVSGAYGLVAGIFWYVLFQAAFMAVLWPLYRWIRKRDTAHMNALIQNAIQ